MSQITMQQIEDIQVEHKILALIQQYQRLPVGIAHHLIGFESAEVAIASLKNRGIVKEVNGVLLIGEEGNDEG